MKFGSVLSLLLLTAYAVEAQVTITSQDMFNQVGQYYRAYVNTNAEVDVTGVLGTKGGPRIWDFTQGPTDAVWRTEVVPVTDGGHEVDFPKAKFAERLEKDDGSRLWLYLDQVRGQGRVVYGYYAEAEIFDKPSVPFSAPIVDFPDVIEFGSEWSTSTTYTNLLLGVPMIITETATFEADAYGLVNLPELAFGEALRIHSLNEVVIRVDFEANGNFQVLGTEYIRTYYWLRDDHGIAVQIVSTGAASPPPENFTLAAQFVRMFETNHDEGSGDTGPDPVSDLKITRGTKAGQFLLSWSEAANADSYRIEHTEDLGNPDSWVEGATTASNFFLETAGAGTRYYRVISLQDNE